MMILLQNNPHFKINISTPTDEQKQLEKCDKEYEKVAIYHKRLYKYRVKKRTDKSSKEYIRWKKKCEKFKKMQDEWWEKYGSKRKQLKKRIKKREEEREEREK